MTIPLRNQIVARLKLEQRLDLNGETVSVLFVAELDPINQDGSIPDRDGFDLTVIADERYVSVGFWYDNSSAPASFRTESGYFQPVVTNDPFAGLGAAEILETTKARNRLVMEAIMEAIIAETEQALDAAAARLTNGG